jgi:hypothetical protein
MKKLAMLLVAMVLMACGEVTGPDTSDIPGVYVINYHIEFDFSIGLHPPYAHAGGLILHDDRTLDIYLRTCIWDECQDDEGAGTWYWGEGGRHNRMRDPSGLRICSDPSIASTPWLSDLEVWDETCLTFFWKEPCCEGELGRWDTRDLDPGQGVQRWLSLERAVTVATEEE